MDAMIQTIFDTFTQQYKIAPNGCWIWQRCLVKGYGVFTHDKKLIYAHRYSYELRFGKIPDNLEIHHLCYYKACVNPEHMKLITRAEHLDIENKFYKTLTYCKKGHELTSDNVYMSNGRNGNINRTCKKCHTRRINFNQALRKLGKLGR